MNNTLIYNLNTDEYNLWNNYLHSPMSCSFFKTLDDNIIAVQHNGNTDVNITFTFKDEISKMFFILKYL